MLRTVSCHQSGMQVIKAILDLDRAELVPIMRLNFFELAQDQFGNFAVQKLIDISSKDEIKDIC